MQKKETIKDRSLSLAAQSKAMMRVANKYKNPEMRQAAINLKKLSQKKT